MLSDFVFIEKDKTGCQTLLCYFSSLYSVTLFKDKEGHLFIYYNILFLPCFGLWSSQLLLISFIKSENPFIYLFFLTTIPPPADVDSKTAMQTLWLRWEWPWFLIKALWWISIISGSPGVIRLIIWGTGSRSVSGAAKHQQLCLFNRLNKRWASDASRL